MLTRTLTAGHWFLWRSTSDIPRPTGSRAGSQRATGKSLTEVVIEALKDRLRREQRRAASPRLKEQIMAISRRASALPRRTGRSADEIIGYDEDGLPH